MVHIRMILTLSIAILAVDNGLVEAGKGTEYRIEKLSDRAAEHKNMLRPQQNKLKKKFGSMTDQVKNQLIEINDAIIDHIMDHKSFSKYLEDVFLILQEYAVRQMKERYEKLKNVYEEWENKNFPDKDKKAQALKILKKQKNKKKLHKKRKNRRNMK